MLLSPTIDQHKYDKAIADFSAAIQVDPKYADAYFNRGNAHDNKGEYAEAIADYSTVTQLEPQNVDAYNSLAWDLATAPQESARDGKKQLSWQQRPVSCRLGKNLLRWTHWRRLMRKLEILKTP